MRRRQPNYSYSSYAAFRPVYPHELYTTILSHHSGGRAYCLDLGCGHGVVTRALAPYFTSVTGIDPSSGMITQAESSTPASSYSGVSYRTASAESLPFLEDGSVDMVVAGQAAHWFDYAKLWPEMARVVRRGGTIAFWGYADCVFPEYPAASQILRRYAYGKSSDLLGPYWSRPGRNIVENRLRDIVLPAGEWDDVKRMEYEPGASEPSSGEGTMFLQRKMAVSDVGDFVRTWSGYHGWKEAHPGEERRADGKGTGDVVDRLLDEIKAEEDWKSPDTHVVVEWPTGLIMGRRR